MFAYVARQPIFDKEKEVYAYELLFRDGQKNCFPDIEPDEATSKIITESHLSWGVEEITDGKLAFINFHQNTLLYRFPTSLDPKNVVIEVVETVKVDEDLTRACKHIRGLGYQIALDDYDGEAHWDIFLPFTSIVKFEVNAFPDDEMQAIVNKLKKRRIQLVAERVETREEFDRYANMGFDLFQGYFLARPEIVRHRKLNASQNTMLELLTATANTPLDFAEINSVFERDPALTYKLLRFINSPTMDKRIKINNLRHAFNYMGEVELKKFIALLALANLSAAEPHELLNMSLVRAKFCELAAKTLNESGDPMCGFLTGLLSLMDTLTGQEMKHIISKIPVDSSVQDALNNREGLLRDCLKMVSAFEYANWRQLKALSSKYPIKQTQLHAIYVESLKWSSAVQSIE